VTKHHNTQEPTNFSATGDDLEGNLASTDTLGLTDVEVQIEKIAERQRQITAKIQIPQPAEQVWKVLTDYEALADFIPNLDKSRRIEHPDGGIRLEQIGSQRLLRFSFCARVVLDLIESFPQEINFQMVEGDLKAFSGSWRLESCSLGDKTGTNLCYSIFIWPKRTMPVSFIENRLSRDMQVNLVAIRQRVEAFAT
jgi:ribosome-associated toxin RatA of RatAB toxin-antitoxin module